ncbi:hypothetical protein NLJ89_g869 [Agrocybe chaxingu]|uniref:Autophagy-related protein 27 n=1 Tax=Agrocybe chaxingu TaxID=84603 RepID=A0A9W8TG17_9AGAR|nr:hypothetical protein NLJ89_g869 [Agrocybe chaxingu]
MILRSQRRDFDIILSLFFSYLLLSVLADSPFDCHISVNDVKFDLTKLAGEHTVNRTRTTPPTVTVDFLRFDLCADLKPRGGVAEQDQCPEGTRVCLTEVNQKENEADRVTAVIPLAQTNGLEPVFSSSLAPKYMSLLFHGPTYSNHSLPQSFNLTLFCDPQVTSEPEITSYNGTTLNLEWYAPAGCPFQEGEGGDKDEDKGGDEGKEESVGSGIGWFFLVFCLAFAAYFILGAYYNYSTYGATGLDLIP